MLDIKRIRTNFDEVESLLKRKGDYSVAEAKKADEEKRGIMAKAEELRARQNAASREISQMKRDGRDSASLTAEMKGISSQAKSMQEEISRLDAQIESILLSTPNTPSPDTAIGESEKDNPVVRAWGEPTKFAFAPQAHWDIGAALDILDFERAAKIAGARFPLWKGKGAKMERALVSYMLDLHTQEEGYTEILPPLMANRKSMTGTGQLPKFEEDAFSVQNNGYFLVPTAEVPLTNMFSGEILPAESLPMLFTAYTPCFRAEAGSAGRDTRGLIRNHQFDKVELVKFADPKNSYGELESLTQNAENVLQKLGLPYRVVELCTGDLGFSSAKTYDIEVWMPSYSRYVEISSCSNMTDYQARRANIRFRDESGKIGFVHTLNGSALAVGRAFAAILENFQQEDGSVQLPEALHPYMGGLKALRAQ
jgi:seryl-tRNA synthetase